MKSAPNKRRWIIPVAWLGTAAAAFSIGRMSSWLEEPLTPPAPSVSSSGAGGSSSAGGSGLPSHDRIGSAFAAGNEKRPVLSVGEVTAGQPLGDWLKKLMAQDDDIYRMQHFMQLFDALNNVDDVKAALEVMGGTGGRGRGMRFTEYSMLLQKLTRLDPKEALTYTEKVNGGERFMATGTVLRTWSKSEPDAALAWAKEFGTQQQQNEDGNNRGRRGGDDDRPPDNWALASVVTQLAKSNLDKAIHEATSNELGRTSGRTAEALLSEAIEQRGVDEAMKMVNSLAEGDFRNEWVQSLAQRLGRTEPEKAQTWLSSMPSGEVKARAMGQFVDQWAERDAAAASAYVNKLPVGPDYDRSRIEVAQRSLRENPNEALALVGKISDPQVQTQTVTRFAFDLMRRDPQSAQQFVMASPLPEENKATIIQQGQQFQQRRGGGGGDFNDFRGGGGRRFGGGGGGGGGGRGR